MSHKVIYSALIILGGIATGSMLVPAILLGKYDVEAPKECPVRKVRNLNYGEEEFCRTCWPLYDTVAYRNLPIYRLSFLHGATELWVVLPAE